MAGPRLTGPRLLRQMSRVPVLAQKRPLHMTGAERAPRMPTTSTPVQQPIASITPSSSEATSDPSLRHLNTTRTLKAVNDSSTIDFAYLPTFALPALPHHIEAEAPTWQIPILPSATHRYDAISPNTTHNLDALRAQRDSDEGLSPEAADASSSEPVVYTPVIVTAAHESTYINPPSAMSDVHDGAEHHGTDFHEVSEVLSSGKVQEKVGETMEKIRDATRGVVLGMEREGQEIKQSKGLLKQIWTGLVDDLTGGKTTAGKS